MLMTTSTLLLHGFLALVTLFFGALALYPLFLDPREVDAPATTPPEDVVLSIAPSMPTERTPARITPLPLDDGDRRPAA